MGALLVEPRPSGHDGTSGGSATVSTTASGDAATERLSSKIRWTNWSTWLGTGDGVREGEGEGGNGCSQGCNLGRVPGSLSSASSN